MDLVLNICLFIWILLLASATAELPLKDKGIYKIISKEDGGVLTLSSKYMSGDEGAFIKVKEWKDEAGQKWKAKNPQLSKSYEFKPTVDEGIRLDGDKHSGFNVIARVTKKNTKFWYVKSVGGGSFMIKNTITGTCITNQGRNQKVKLSICDNSYSQQWTFKIL